MENAIHLHNADRRDDAFRRDAYKEFYRDEFDSLASDDHARDLVSLTEFVRRVIDTTDTPFTFSHAPRHIVKKSLPLSHYLKLLPRYVRAIRLLPDEFEYEELLTVFIHSCKAFDALLDVLLSLDTRVEPNVIIASPDTTVADLFNQLVNQIRIEWKTGRFSVKFSKRISRLKQQYRSYCEYADSLFKKRSELIVIRVDFSYQKAHQTVDAYQATADLDRMISSMRKSPKFRGLEGYIIKLEYGISKGIHFHSILFFDRSVRHRLKHVGIAEKIGEYWKEKITKGRGIYWNVNAHANDYERLGKRGIGPIHRDDVKRRANLADIVVQYLFKASQFIRPKSGSRVNKIRRKELKK